MLQGKQYVSLMKTGVAELGAFGSLYDSVRETIFPVFHARPWPNAKKFQLTVDKVLQAVQGRPFGFGLELERKGAASFKPAQKEFDGLFDPAGGFRSYYEFIESIPSAVPVLIPTRSSDTLLRQIGNADTLDRGLIIHQRRGGQTPISDAITKLPPLPHDSVIIIDAGWSRDYTALEAWALPMAEKVLAGLPEAEVVIMASSFPDSFTHIVGNAEELGMERRLYNAIRQKFNFANLTYGDWGSTRPNLNGGGGGDIPSRVDLPKITSWEIFRADPDHDLGFSELAWEAQHHHCFHDTPECWGKQMIKSTDDMGAGITSRKISTEVRINIHLTVQSGAESILPTDEVPYVD